MDKNDIVDLILKAAAIYLFILAIVAVPRVIEGIILLLLLAQTEMAKYTVEAPLFKNFSNASISSTIGGCIRFILYIILGRNLFNGGSWIKYFFGEKNFTQSKNPENVIPGE